LLSPRPLLVPGLRAIGPIPSELLDDINMKNILRLTIPSSDTGSRSDAC
jgi:hypothetical protein